MNSARKRLLAASIAVLLSFSTAVQAAESDSRVQAAGPADAARPQRPDWTLIDYRSREYRAADLDGQLHVIAFLGTECPLAKLYSSRLQALCDKYADRGLSVIGIDANVQDSLEDLAAFARRQNIRFPLLKDPDASAVTAYGATRTPEVFLISAQGNVLYHGAIDDQYVVGLARDHAENEYLKDAIEAALSGKSVRVSSTPATGCLIGRPPTTNKPTQLTYASHIAGIMNQYCVSCHHADDIGPMAFDNYDDVVAWSDMIREVIIEERMPPWHADPSVGHFVNDRSLPADAREQLFAWIDGGCPSGDLTKAPPALTFTDGWQLDRQPDIEFAMRDKPFNVPATGEVKYQYFRVDPKFKEDVWVQAAEIKPGNRLVVHHVLVFAVRPGKDRNLEAARGYLTGYVPGTRVEPYPAGMAKKIPAGSHLVFQVHYTPVGTEQLDTSRVGFWLADPPSITHEVQTTSVVQPRLRIPPGDGDWKTEAYLPEKLPESQLISMSPHMHLRGKSFTYDLVSPNGGRKPLLRVPKYDFNWQTAYILKDRLPIAEGSRLFCTASFDNSDDNPYNPDPNKEVRWGDQTDDEMMIGYFDIAVPIAQ